MVFMNCVIKWVVIYSTDSAVHPFNNCGENVFAEYIALFCSINSSHREVID